MTNRRKSLPFGFIPIQLTLNSDWMEIAFEKANSAEHSGKSEETAANAIRKGGHSSTISKVHQDSKPNIGEKRIRLVDKLDGPRQPSTPSTVISGADRRGFEDRIQVVKKRTPPGDSGSLEGTLQQVPQLRRVTRSQDDKQAPTDGSKDTEIRAKAKPSETGILGNPWTRDLVYPKPGKRSATVPFEDLRRLDDDEFLNDNLIAFFMQYLEHDMEKNQPDLHKRVHFFNTYFYETLTKNSKAKRGINYDAVSRWTKAINLFSRDFVVVPVNENFHWYLAIICNLPFFMGRPTEYGEEQSDDKSQEIEDLMSQVQESHDVHQQSELPTEETQKSLAGLSISDNEQNGRSPVKGQLKKGPGRRKVRRSLPKYEIDKPVIITLDSLGSARSATCSFLRQYVSLEARDKRGMDIDPAELRGMTAKEIPTQNNFSDCGLYLCMYLEQFVADPYNFVRRILQRQENTQQWPRRIQSEDLRSRLRELILEVHRRQEKEPPKMDLPELGSIMIEKNDPSPEPTAIPKLHIKKDIQEAKQRFQSIASARRASTESQSEAKLATAGHPSPIAIQLSADAAEEGPDTTDEDDEDDPIIVSEGNLGLTQRKRQPQTEPLHSANTKPSESSIQVRASPPTASNVHVSDTQPPPNATPRQLADNMRRQDEERESNKRRRRSMTALTEFLSGIDSYAQHNSSTLRGMPGSWSDKEDILNGNGQEGRTGNEAVVRVKDSPRPSPGPEVVAERKIRPDEALHGRRKRKRYHANEERSAHEGGKWTGFDDGGEAECPETQQTYASQREGSTVKVKAWTPLQIFEDPDADLDAERKGTTKGHKGPEGQADDNEMLLI